MRFQCVSSRGWGRWQIMVRQLQIPASSIVLFHIGCWKGIRWIWLEPIPEQILAFRTQARMERLAKALDSMGRPAKLRHPLQTLRQTIAFRFGLKLRRRQFKSWFRGISSEVGVDLHERFGAWLWSLRSEQACRRANFHGAGDLTSSRPASGWRDDGGQTAPGQVECFNCCS